MHTHPEKNHPQKAFSGKQAEEFTRGGDLGDSLFPPAFNIQSGYRPVQTKFAIQGEIPDNFLRTVQRATAFQPIQRQETGYSYSREVSDGPYGWNAAYEVVVGPETVAITINVRIDRDAGVTEAQQRRVESVTAREFARYFDRRFDLTDTEGNSRQLTVNLNFVESGEHLIVALHGGSGRDNLSEWYVDSEPIDRAHELGHQLGLRDEYVDEDVPDRATEDSPGVTSDHSIMGNYYAQGIRDADVRLRHGQEIAGDISAATGTEYTAQWSSSYVVRKGDSLSAISRRIYGDANKWRDIYDLNRDIIRNPDLIFPDQILHLPPR